MLISREYESLYIPKGTPWRHTVSGYKHTSRNTIYMALYSRIYFYGVFRLYAVAAVELLDVLVRINQTLVAFAINSFVTFIELI